MATLREAIEKVGVGGCVLLTNTKPFTVNAVGKYHALLSEISGGFNDANNESYYRLDTVNWYPHTEPKRVVLQAWRNMTTGFTVFLGEGETFNSKHGYVRRQDIPDMITEDGKWVFE